MSQKAKSNKKAEGQVVQSCYFLRVEKLTLRFFNQGYKEASLQPGPSDAHVQDFAVPGSLDPLEFCLYGSPPERILLS